MKMRAFTLITKCVIRQTGLSTLGLRNMAQTRKCAWDTGRAKLLSIVLPQLLCSFPLIPPSLVLFHSKPINKLHGGQVLCRRPRLSECILFKDRGGKSDCGLEGQPLALSWGSKPGYSPLTGCDVCVCVFVSVALSPLHHLSSNRPQQSPWVVSGRPESNPEELLTSLKHWQWKRIFSIQS